MERRPTKIKQLVDLRRASLTHATLKLSVDEALAFCRATANVKQKGPQSQTVNDRHAFDVGSLSFLEVLLTKPELVILKEGAGN